MKAYTLQGTGSADALQLADLPLPACGPGEVLIRTRAIDINPVDSKTLQGLGQYSRIKDDPPIILGWGFSGEVTDTGEGVASWRKGDAVFGLVNFPGHGKTYAEYVAAPAGQLALKPPALPHEEAAASTLAALIAWQALQKAAVQPGERVLVQGAAGGVGSFAVQIAKAMGAYVIGTARAQDEDWLRQHGLDELIDYTTSDFGKATSGIDFVLDTLGGQAALKALDLLSARGRLITLPSGAGDEWKKEAEERHLKADFQFVHSSGDDMQELARRLAAGRLYARIAHRFHFHDIPGIHRQMLDKKISGKIVVTVP